MSELELPSPDGVSPTVFLSYRRRDRAVVIELAETLRADLGSRNVFRDEDDLIGGQNWREEIRDRIARSNSVLVLVGVHWEGVREDGSRRIDDPNDVVRTEVEQAIDVEGGARATPVLVDRGVPAELPATLRPLFDAHAVQVARSSLDAESGSDYPRVLAAVWNSLRASVVDGVIVISDRNAEIRLAEFVRAMKDASLMDARFLSRFGSNMCVISARKARKRAHEWPDAIVLVGDDEASDYLLNVIRALDEHPGIKRVAVIGAASALLSAAELTGSAVAYGGTPRFVAAASGTTGSWGSMVGVKVAVTAVAVVGLAALGSVAIGVIDVGGDEDQRSTADAPFVTEDDSAESGDDGDAADDTAGSSADDSAPAIDSFELSPAPASAETPVRISVLSSDRESGVAEIVIAVDGSIAQTCPADSCDATIGPLPTGEYDVSVSVRDHAGNVAEDRRSLVVDPDPPVDRPTVPDLVVESFDVVGAATPVGETWQVPVELVVANIGTGAAGPFSYSVSDDFLRSFIIDGRVDFGPSIDGLGPGQSIVVERAAVAFSSYPDGPRQLVVHVDSCAGREFAAAECDVVETDESNNTSSPRLVDFPPIARIAGPSESLDMDRQPDGSFDVGLDATGSFDADDTRLTYQWTVERRSDGVEIPISTSAAEAVNFDLPAACGDNTYRYRLEVTDETGNTAANFVDVAHNLICID